MVNSPILDSLYSMGNQIISFIPTLIVVIILLIVGLIVGKLLGKIGGKVLDKVGLDDLVDRTAVGDMIKKADMSTVHIFEAIIRWFVYLIFAVIIIDFLRLDVVADFITRIISFIPLIFSALVVLIIGLLLVDFIAGLVKKVLVTTGVDDKIATSVVGDVFKASGTTVSGIISGLVRLFGYLIFIMAAFEILRFAIITEFLQSILDYLPHLFMGILILLIGLLVIDFIMDYLQATIKGMKVENTEVVIPLLRVFLFLVIILLALDIMLINTSIFYVFLGPLAWGFAIVVAFKWGIKEALVAYAEAKK
ncbi:MAG: hypothetical protein IBX39_03100 [Candidatus Methanoperedenaceae archaeon]|nr:hypothetical protein [Candidatus Methanoperedenaceae archaeon]